jgi:hypothetical protein
MSIKYYIRLDNDQTVVITCEKQEQVETVMDQVIEAGHTPDLHRGHQLTSIEDLPEGTAASWELVTMSEAEWLEISPVRESETSDTDPVE